MFEHIKEELKNISIEGGNLRKQDDVSFDLISNHFSNLSDESKKILEHWQNFYFQIFEKLQNNEFPTNPLKVENGVVIVDNGQLFHRSLASIETFKGISKVGIVATEWFGILESENEAYCCAFLDQLQEELPYKEFGRLLNKEEERYLNQYREALHNRNAAFSSYPSFATFFLDNSNQIMQMLMKFDFFEYLKNKKEHPEKIKEIYPTELINLYEKVCDAENMEFSSKFHDANNYKRKTWLAIPLGIPPFLINGICINSKSEIINHLDEISEMFPNAIIFNENKDVLKYPLSKEENAEVIEEIHSEMYR